MAKKFTTKSHLVDINGNLVAPGTEIEESQLGDAAAIKRYSEQEAIEDARDSVIVSGEATDETREKVQDEAEAAVKNADKRK